MKKVRKKTIRLYTGWGIRGRPFSPREFQRSYVRRNFRIPYYEYLRQVAKHVKNPKKYGRL